MPILGGFGNASEYAYRSFIVECPLEFNFEPVSGVNPGEVIKTSYQKILGTKNPLLVRVVGSGVSFSIKTDVFDNGRTESFDSLSKTFDSFSDPNSRFASDDKFVLPNDSVILSYTPRNEVKDDFGITYVVDFFVGKCNFPWEVSTRPIDNIPENFSFTAVDQQTVNTTIESNEIVVSGLEPGYTFPFSVLSENYIYYGPSETGSKTEEEYVSLVSKTFNDTTEFTIPGDAYDVELLVSGGGSGEGGDALRESGFSSQDIPFRTNGGAPARGQLLKIFAGTNLSGKTFKWWGATNAEDAAQTSLSGQIGRNITEGGAGGVSDYSISGTYIKGGNGGENRELRERLGKLSKSGAGGGGGAPGIITRRETTFDRLLVIAAGASGGNGASPGDEGSSGITPSIVVKSSSGSSLKSGENGTSGTTWGGKGGQGAGSRPGGAPTGWIWDDPSFKIDSYEVDTKRGEFNRPELILNYKQIKTRVVDTTSPVVLKPNVKNCKIIVNDTEEYSFGSTANLENGDRVKLRVITSQNYDTLSTILFGNLNGNSIWVISTGKLNLNPTFDPTDFNDVSGAELSTQYDSNAVTVKNLSSGVQYPVQLSNANAKADVNEDGTFRTSPFNVINNDRIRIRLTSSSSYSTAVSTNITIGNKTVDWNVTTRSAPPPPRVDPPPPCVVRTASSTYGTGFFGYVLYGNGMRTNLGFMTGLNSNYPSGRTVRSGAGQSTTYGSLSSAIINYYVGTIRRYPEAAGFDGWINRYQQGAFFTPQNLVDEIDRSYKQPGGERDIQQQRGGQVGNFDECNNRIV